MACGAVPRKSTIADIMAGIMLLGPRRTCARLIRSPPSSLKKARFFHSSTRRTALRNLVGAEMTITGRSLRLLTSFFGRCPRSFRDETAIYAGAIGREVADYTTDARPRLSDYMLRAMPSSALFDIREINDHVVPRYGDR
jgi:hypothetical protein